mmetsp:Transcript_28427/g.47016  ORF Transcript_28427/g.47016 Transcript_28427/m.47016 type:complete len:219 (+) Transcript_28427:110-766(+)
MKVLCLLYFFLELHCVWLVVSIQRETGGQVSFQHWSAFYNLQKNSVNSLLVSLALIRDYCCLWGVTQEKFIFSLNLLILGSSKVSIVETGSLDSTDINLGGRRNHICSIHTSKRDAIDFVWTSHQKKTGFQNTQTNHALATESSSQEDQDSSRGDGRADFRRVLLDHMLDLGPDVLSRVVSWALRGVSLGCLGDLGGGLLSFSCGHLDLLGLVLVWLF